MTGRHQASTRTDWLWDAARWILDGQWTERDRHVILVVVALCLPLSIVVALVLQWAAS